MTETDIIEALQRRLASPVGRHLYGVLGSYDALHNFAQKLVLAKMPDGPNFPPPLSVNQGILNAIPDEEFKELAQNEAKRPEPTAKRVSKAFKTFLRSSFASHRLVVLAHMELLFAYAFEPDVLRTHATDDHRILLLLPGRREKGAIVLFPELDNQPFIFPSAVIADNHLWELK